MQNKKNLIDIDETEPYPKEPNSCYEKAKMLAEKYILRQNGPMKGLILRPTFIWGKSVKALETLIDKIKSNDFMWIDNGKSWFEMVHVKSLAEAVYLLLKNGQDKDKEIYFVTDNNPQSAHSFLSKLLKTQGITPPKKNIPKRLAVSLAAIIEKIWKTFKLKSTPPITIFDIAFVAMSRKYNISKIKKDLYYKPIVSEKEGLIEMTINQATC